MKRTVEHILEDFKLNIESVLGLNIKWSSVGGDKYRSRCPSHKGEGTSLDIKVIRGSEMNDPKGDRVVFNCHVCGDQEVILKSIGMKKSDFFLGKLDKSKSDDELKEEIKKDEDNASYGCTEEEFYRDVLGDVVHGVADSLRDEVTIYGGNFFNVSSSMTWISILKKRVPSTAITILDRNEIPVVCVGNDGIKYECVKERVRIRGKDKYRYRKGSDSSKSMSGQQWLFLAQEKRFLIIGEGETDERVMSPDGPLCLNLSYPFYGIPGTGMVKKPLEQKILHEHYFEGLDGDEHSVNPIVNPEDVKESHATSIFIMREPGEAGLTFPENVARSIDHVVPHSNINFYSFTLGEFSDPLEMMKSVKDNFDNRPDSENDFFGFSVWQEKFSSEFNKFLCKSELIDIEGIQSELDFKEGDGNKTIIGEEDEKDKVKKEPWEEFEFTLATNVMKSTYAPTQWALPGLMPNGFGFWVARSKTGKSSLVLDLATGCSRGQSVFGQDKFLPKKQTVVILDLEQPLCESMQKKYSKYAINGYSGIRNESTGEIERYDDDILIFQEWPRFMSPESKGFMGKDCGLGKLDRLLSQDKLVDSGNETYIPPVMSKDGSIELAKGYSTLNEGTRITKENSRIKIVFIDIWALIKADGRGINLPGLNAYELEYASMHAAAMLALKHNITIVAVHHKRKASSGSQVESVIDSLSGTMAASGAVNFMWFINREIGDKSGTIQTVGRGMPEYTMHATFEDQRWTVEVPDGFILDP